MSVSYDTPVRPTRKPVKIHSGAFTHDQLPALPCSARKTHHLRTNNLLGLQAAFQCNTIHHACKGVTLAKPTDDNPHVSGVRDPGTAKIDNYFRFWEGPLSDQTRDDLRKNDLDALGDFLYLAYNDPTPGQ